jgi:Tol biopolymer transport system component
MRRIAFVALAASVTLALHIVAAPAPPPGPQRLLVVSSSKDGNWDIYLVQPGTGETKNLTRHKASDTEPIWSPDGKRIAFVSDRDGTADIWMMNADGTKPKPLTNKQGACSNLRWSPDGSRIAFVSPNKANRDQVFTVEVAKGTVKQITTLTSPSRQPAWSPDSKTLSYTYYVGRYSTYTVATTGGVKKKLTDTHGGVDAAWSPDGSRIAFGAITDPNNSGFCLFTITPDRKTQVQLTDTPNSYGNVYPQWSPDGTQISYGELVDGVLQVAIINADGSGAKVITAKHQHAFTRWSPDGKSLSYTRFEKDKPPTLVVSDTHGNNTKELIPHIGAPAEWKPK